MRLRVQDNGVELSDEERRVIERHVRLALGRHMPRVRAGRVTLSPGLETTLGRTRCRFQLRLHGEDPIRVEEAGDDAPTAVSRATWRAVRRLERSTRVGHLRTATRSTPRVAAGDPS